MEIYSNSSNDSAAARTLERRSSLDLQLSLRPPVQNSSSSVVLLPPPPPRRSAGRSHIQRANSITSHRISRNPGIRRSSPSPSSTAGRCNSRSFSVRASLAPCTREIRPPYPWSTARRAVVHTLNHLKLNRIVTISGEVRCRRCQRQYQIEYDLISKFEEIANFVENNKDSFHDRAPSEWMNPNYPRCKFCDLENGARPVIEEEKRINWLFLLLGQMLGSLSLNHLKYFCGCTDNHRTGAKNRLLYLTYLTLCNQVDPSGRFSR